MDAHSYNQYCPIAHALDLVGDRWALLIVRDLIMGPKRFTDLKGGLPGLGTNILTTRLKSLERSGVVARRALPFPAAATVYELTAYGRKLGTTLDDLARWGSETLGPLRPAQAVSPDAVMLTLDALFRARVHAAPRATYAVHVGAPETRATVGVHIGDGVVSVSRDAPERPDVTLSTDVETVVDVVGGRLSLREAIERGAVRMDGDPTVIADLIAADPAAGIVA
jgi:DNA-binding HxlR family transcriptional regulator